MKSFKHGLHKHFFVFNIEFQTWVYLCLYQMGTLCKTGTVKDLCGCCDVCAQAVGEVCGGILLNNKKCGNQLTCVKNKSTDLMGICQPKCGPVCKIFCKYGNVLDVNGCPTCRCNDPPICGPVCDIYCPYGNVLDANGCPTCLCNSQPICGPVCMIFCENGYVLDESGCPTCQCIKNAV
ncbi:antistasin-like isoform X2 [Hydra vulgaris]|uniref:Antistasin-like isoform X2 n=1 Tax=Hydra vulgaris TaxID=6087 RepID=A0ABM4B7Y1_HYDVU